MKIENKVFAGYSILGVIAGIATYMLFDFSESIITAIIGLYIIAILMKKILNSEEKVMWFFKNGGYIYIFIWFATWILMYNLV